MVARSTMMHGLERVVLAKGKEAELKMIRFPLGMTRINKISNEYI